MSNPPCSVAYKKSTTRNLIGQRHSVLSGAQKKGRPRSQVTRLAAAAQIEAICQRLAQSTRSRSSQWMTYHLFTRKLSHNSQRTRRPSMRMCLSSLKESSVKPLVSLSSNHLSLLMSFLRAAMLCPRIRNAYPFLARRKRIWSSSCRLLSRKIRVTGSNLKTSGREKIENRTVIVCRKNVDDRSVSVSSRMISSS